MPETIQRVSDHLKAHPYKYTSATNILETGAILLMDLDDGILADLVIIRNVLADYAANADQDEKLWSSRLEDLSNNGKPLDHYGKSIKCEL